MGFLMFFFPFSRMKPVSSSNDVAMDALDFDRMKQVSVKVFHTSEVW